MEFLRVENLYKVYGKGENQVTALDGVSLTIEKGLSLIHIQMCIRDSAWNGCIGKFTPELLGGDSRIMWCSCGIVANISSFEVDYVSGND